MTLSFPLVMGRLLDELAWTLTDLWERALFTGKEGLTTLSLVRRAWSFLAIVLHDMLQSAMLMASLMECTRRGKYSQSRLGELNMTLIIWLRFNTKNTVAIKLDKKLECWDQRFLSSARLQWNAHARKYKENEAIGKKYMSGVPLTLQIAGGGRCYSNELVYSQQKNDEVKAHRVNEDCSKIFIVGLRYLTSYSSNPNYFHLNSYEECN